MIKIITDEKKVNEVLTRGVEKIYPDKKSLRKLLLSGKRARLYCGFDPSAPALHIGNAILINKLAQFQALGHEVIFLIGDFTGMIGDPTDKLATRKKMTRAAVKENSKNYQAEASAYLNFSGANPAKVRYNSEWNDKLTFKGLIELSANFTVQQMIQRDMFQKRLKNEQPIHLHEFLYPLAQGYDSLAMDVDLEIGGNDQMFNMMAGRDLMKAVKKKEKYVLTMKLLADDKGVKMGKTTGNAVFLNVDPKNMYGIIMSWPDEVIGVGFELCTKASMDEVNEVQKKLRAGKVNPRDLKMKLALAITKLVHGEEKAQEAEEYFIKIIQKKEVPGEITEKTLKIANCKLVDLLVKIGLASSKGEARRLIKQGGIKLDGKVAGDAEREIKIGKAGTLLQRGKRQFVRVIGN